MQKIINSFLAKVQLFFEWMLAGIFGAMLIIGALQIGSRTLLNSPIIWTEEIMRYLFVWATFIAAGLGFPLGIHIGVDIFVNYFPNWLKKFLEIFIWSCVFLFGLVLASTSWKMIFHTLRQISPVTNIPIAWVYTGIFLGGVLTTVNGLWMLLLSLLKYVGGRSRST